MMHPGNNLPKKPLVKISRETLEELKKQAVVGAAPSPYEQLMMQRRDPMQGNIDNLRKGMQNPSASIADRERMQRSITSLGDQMGMRHANDPMYQRAQMETLRNQIRQANPQSPAPAGGTGMNPGDTTGWRGDFAPQMKKRDHAEEVRPFQPRSAYDSGNYNRPGGSELGRQPLPVRSSVARVSQEAMPVNQAALDPQYYSAKARGVQPPAPAPAASAPPDMYEQAKQKLLATNKNLGVAGHADNTAFINSLKQNFGDNYQDALRKDPSKLMDLASNYKAPTPAPAPAAQPPHPDDNMGDTSMPTPPAPGGNGNVNIPPPQLTSTPPAAPAANIPAPMQKNPNAFAGTGQLSLGGNAAPASPGIAPIKPAGNPIDASTKPEPAKPAGMPEINPSAGNSKMAAIGKKLAELASTGLPAMGLPAEMMDGMGGNSRMSSLGHGKVLGDSALDILGKATSRKGVAADVAGNVNSMPGFNKLKPLLKAAPKYIASHGIPIASGIGDIADTVGYARKGDTTGAVISGLGAMGTPMMMSGIPPVAVGGAALSFGAPIVNTIRDALNEPEGPVPNRAMLQELPGPKLTPEKVQQMYSDQSSNVKTPVTGQLGGSPRVTPPAPQPAQQPATPDINSWIKQNKPAPAPFKKAMLKAAEYGFKKAAIDVGIEASFANGMFEEVKEDLFKQASEKVEVELGAREFKKQSKLAFDGFIEQLKKEGANQAFIEGFMKEANQTAPAPQGMPSGNNAMDQNRHNVVPGMNNNILGLGGGLLLGALANNMFDDDDDDEPSPIRSIGMPLMGALLGHRYLPQLMNSWKDPYGSGANEANPLTAAYNKANPVMSKPISSPMSNPMVNPTGNVMTPNTPKTFPEFLAQPKAL